MPLSRPQFVERLTSSGVLSADEVADFEQKVAAARDAADAQTYAKLLVQHGRLTKYQAAAVYQGKTKGLVLGNYVLLDKLGAGGMGQVFKALHRRMDRVVALKVLPAEATKSPENVKRFHREVKAAARLEHPNIVTAHDADEADGTHFLVMQYVDGKDLSAIVKENGPLPVAQAVECIRQAAHGLSYAHKRGVIHRDIKPANLLVDSDGTVKILDMGLARLEGQMQDAASIAGLTQSGQVMGTVDYMSPEQAEETRSVDARADQYSLGCTLWVLLTGRPMFGGTTTIAKLMAHRTTPAPSLRAARADVPEALEALYQRMVAKEPDERYASMDEVIAALATCLGEAAPAQLDGPSSSDSKLTEFFRQIGGAKTGAPPVSVTAVDAETIQHQPVKDDTGTAHVDKPQPSGTSPVAPEPTIALASAKPVAQPAPSAAKSKARRGPLHPLAMVVALAVGGLSVVGGLLALLLWLVLPGERPVPPADTKSTFVVDSIDAAPPLAIAPFSAAEAQAHQQAWADYLGLPVEKEITLPGGEKLTMVLIPPGEFLMGSTSDDQARFLAEAKAASDTFTMGRIPSEGPQHRVRITKPFYLGKYEVTQAQWQSVMGTNPSTFKDHPTLPVEQVNWDDIQAFVAKLDASMVAQRMTFSLPTEAQWEYACRSGTTTVYYGGDRTDDLKQYGWFSANSGGKTHPVGGLQPNAFGLFDMHGNVCEWCADWLEADYYAKAPTDDPIGPSIGSGRVHRGGGWSHHARCSRSAHRNVRSPDYRYGILGFRLAATIDVAKLVAARKPAGFALDFDGRTSYVEIPTMQLPNGPLTVEAWITPRKTDREAIFHCGGESFVSLHTFQNTLGFWREAPSYLKSVNNSRLVPGERIHVAGVWDGNMLRAFVNGQASGPGKQIPPELTVNKMLVRAMIGGEHRNGKLTGLFDGEIDELRVSTIARYTKDFHIVAPFGRMQADEHTLALYHFDEGAGEVLRDSSGNEHHGKIVGAKWVRLNDTTAAAKPLANYALTFDGETSVDLPATIQLDQDADFTLEAYATAREFPKYAAIVGSKLRTEIVLNNSGGLAGNPRWTFAADFGEPHGGVAAPPQDFALIRRTHIAAVRQGRHYRVFVNGKLAASKPIDQPLRPIDQPWRIGKAFIGEIDEVRISTAARYQTDFTPEPRFAADAYTLALYHCDEGAGDVLRDSSGNNHHGKIVGAKWVRAGGAAIDFNPQGRAAPPPAVAPFDAQAARAHQEVWAKHLGTQVETTNSVGQAMILIPPGEFLMGSTDEQVAAALSAADEMSTDQLTKDLIQGMERPQHRVVISKPFSMSATEVTVEQFKKFSASGYVTEAEKAAQDAKAQTYLSAGSDDLPAAYITWHDAVAYCQWLSKEEKRTYRLPTEAEWEYACRAGTTTQYSFGDDYNELTKYGWHKQNAAGKSQPVGALLANPFGLFDMHGSVHEWCSDYYGEKSYENTPSQDPQGASTGSSRMLRSGLFFYSASSCRSAFRTRNSPSTFQRGVGFRVVSEIDMPAETAAPPGEWSLSFDGAADEVRIEGIDFDDTAQPFTIECWVQPHAFDGHDVAMSLGGRALLQAGRHPETHDPAWMFLTTHVERGRYYVRHGPPLEAPPSAPVHLAGVFDGRELRLYVDGRRQTTPLRISGDSSGPPTGRIELGNPWPGSAVLLGKSAGDSERKSGFNCRIYETRISKTARYLRDFVPERRFASDADTIALYHFDEGAGDELRDSSGNDHHGKIVGATWVPQDVDFAVEFDGVNDFVEISDLDLLARTSVTIEAWVRARSPLGGRKRNQTIVAQQGPNALRALFIEGNSGRGWEARNATSDRASVAFGSAQLAAGTMQHVAMVIDDDALQLFVDGEPVTSNQPDNTREIKSALLPVLIGAFPLPNGAPESFFDGAIDEIRFSKIARYHEAFTPEKSLHTDADTIAIYHCDEGAGEVLRDSSGNNHHGKIVGAKWVRTDDPLPPADASGLKFDGKTALVHVAAEKPVRLAKFTIEAWATPEAEGTYTAFGNTPTGHLYRNGVTTLGALALQYERKDEEHCYWQLACINPQGQLFAAKQTTEVDYGRRSHVAGVYDGQTLTLFVDGWRQSRVAVSGLDEVVVFPLRLGGSELDRGSFVGIVDAVRISSNARYTSQFEPPPRLTKDEHTLALYQFDEGAGDELRDSSGNNHHGKITGAKWVPVERSQQRDAKQP